MGVWEKKIAVISELSYLLYRVKLLEIWKHHLNFFKQKGTTEDTSLTFWLETVFAEKQNQNHIIIIINIKLSLCYRGMKLP